LFKVGFRLDRYDGITSRTGPEPRLGIAYNIKKTGTVLRMAYARTFETPYNENLLLASATGAGGLAQNVFGSNSTPIDPGFRNQFNVGFQQAIGKLLVIDADYFWKYTHNAYDFGTLLNTTLAFPISWHNSKLDGVTGRVSTTNIHGFTAYYTFGHNRARYFFPEDGGLIPQGTPLNGSVFRIDHDQAFQSTLSLRYQRPRNAEWVILTYRYDSGLVVSGVPDAGAALGLTAKLGVKFSPPYDLARVECERLYLAHSLVRPRDSLIAWVLIDVSPVRRMSIPSITVASNVSGWASSIGSGSGEDSNRNVSVLNHLCKVHVVASHTENEPVNNPYDSSRE